MSLSREQENELAVLAKSGDVEARNRLIVSVLPALKEGVARQSQHAEDREDYLQEAVIGVLESVRRYEPSEGDFKSFATPWVKGGKQRWLRLQGWARCYQVDKPSFVSMDSMLVDDGEATLGDVIESGEFQRLERSLVRLSVRKAVVSAELSRQERCVLEIATRLDFDSGFQTECAKLMGISCSRVGQLWRGDDRKVGVVAKLRHALAGLEREAA